MKNFIERTKKYYQPKTWRFISHLVFMLFMLNSICYAEHRSFSCVEQFIHDQKLIRIAMSDSGGYGDLTSSINVMNRLREMGYEHDFEVIYPDDSTNKIINLFDLPSDIPEIYRDSKDKIRFIKLHTFMKLHKENKIDLESFGITGALWYNEYMDDNHHFKNLADFLNVKTFAWTNPWVSTAFPSPINHIFNLIFKSNHDPYKFNEDHSYVIAPISSLTEVKEYLNNTSHGQDLSLKNPALKTFINGIEKKYFNVMAAYGWPINKKINEEYNHDSSPGNILQIIAGARYAQLNGSNELRDKALVIAVFYDYTEELKQLDEAIHHNNWNWGQQNNIGLEHAKDAIKQLGLDQRDVFIVAKISSTETNAQLQNLKPGQLLILSMGPLPKIVFDGLYSYTGDNILPQVREGMGSLSSLIRTGRPHIRCGDLTEKVPQWDLGFDLVSDPSLKINLQEFYNKFCGSMQTWQLHPDIYKSLGELIIEAQNPRSAFSTYFQRIKEEASQSENDRVYRALEKAIQYDY